MFEIDGKHYKIEYSFDRMEQIESATNTRFMQELSNRGMMSFATVKAYVGLGLKTVEGNKYVNGEDALKLGKKVITTFGYQKAVESILEAAQRDLGFLFQKA